MTKIRYLILISAFYFLVTVPLVATSYHIDPNHSEVGFTIRHMRISSVTGMFKQFSGTIFWDPDHLEKSNFSGQVRVDSIDTRIFKRDVHLKTPDFFHSEKFSNIMFKSQSIVPEGDHYRLTGVFTLKGVSKTISVPLYINGPITDMNGKERIGLETRFSLDRRDFNMAWNKPLQKKGWAIGFSVDVWVRIEAIK